MNPRLRIVILPDGDRLVIVDQVIAVQMDTILKHRDDLKVRFAAKSVVVLDGTWDVEVVGGAT